MILVAHNHQNVEQMKGAEAQFYFLSIYEYTMVSSGKRGIFLSPIFNIREASYLRAYEADPAHKTIIAKMLFI